MCTFARSAHGATVEVRSTAVIRRDYQRSFITVADSAIALHLKIDSNICWLV